MKNIKYIVYISEVEGNESNIEILETSNKRKAIAAFKQVIKQLNDLCEDDKDFRYETTSDKYLSHEYFWRVIIDKVEKNESGDNYEELDYSKNFYCKNVERLINEF
jgi:predicted ABC-type ATPase